MNPNPDDDSKLRAAFARQREEDRVEAPVWRSDWLRPPLAGAARTRLHWAPLTLASVCFVLAGVLSMPAFREPPPLTQVLPPLFEAPAGPPPEGLFAGLGPSSFMSAESPSDFLLPPHLTTTSELLLFSPRP